MEDTEETLRRLHELRELGVQIAIDDFGTGYSSFAYLQRFPVDVLKIDQSFVSGPAGLGDSDDALALVQAIVALGETLRIRAVAEGVETATQRDRLLAAGCRIGQGYLFSRPVPASEIDTLLVERTR
jgi:EAL domain-containing protein (putative c-di-GMP-specific phosphodiesterase class I)